MVTHRIAAIFACLTIVWSFAPARASCESGKTADYADIVSVMFERRGCGGLLPPQKNPALHCSNYYVFFWNINQEATYSQYSLRSDRGTYHLETTLEQAVDTLRKDDFFLLNPGEHLVTDIRESVLTVRRCGVVTRLMMYPLPQFDAKVNKLFADFDSIIEHAKKTKIDDNQEDFQYTLLFDGQ
jgi:hypothetical protein